MSLIANVASKRVALELPWTHSLTVARAFLFLGTGITLSVGPSWAIFTPSSGDGRVIHCDGVSVISLFCVTQHVLPLEVVTRVSGALLLVFATGIAPRLTALPAAWILLSVPLSGTLVDGGDQLAGILGVLLLPASLTDPRWNPWRALIPPRVARPAAIIFATTSWWLARTQIVVVYLEACLAKAAVPEWANGTALYAWERHPNFGAPEWAQPLLYSLTSQAIPTAVLTFAVMATEFAIAISPVLPRAFRVRVLFPVGAALHLGIILFMGVSSFSMVMFSALTLLVLPMDTNAWTLRFARRRRRTTAPAANDDRNRTEEDLVARVS